MIQLRITNPYPSEDIISYLSQSHASAVTTLNVKDSSSFAQNDYIVIGKRGVERSESVQISAVPSDTTLTIGATNFAHSLDDRIAKTDFNQIQIYMATSSGGTYSLQATVDIKWDDDVTTWDDTDGETTYYYKFRFYNSTSALTSNYSDAMPGSGWTRTTARILTDEILKEGKDEEERITDRDEMLTWFNEVNDDLKIRLNQYWGYEFLETATTLYTTASSNAVSFPSDFDKFIDIRYGYDSDDDGDVDEIYRLRPVKREEYDYLTQDQTADDSDELQKFTIDENNNRIELYPTPETGSLPLYFYYFKAFPEIDSDGDEVLAPLTAVYKSYCLFKIKNKIGTADARMMAISYKEEYEQSVGKLVARYKRRTGYKPQLSFIPDRRARYFKY